MHKIRGLSDPSTAFILKRLLRSVHKSGRKGDTRLPITEPILLELVKSLTRVTDSYYDQVMFRSIFLLAFYGFLRIGAITVNGINNKNNLKLSNIKLFGKRNVASRNEITMHYFKWHKSNKPVRGNKPGHLFCYPPDKAVCRSCFCTVLKRAVEFSGYDSKLYKSHSFRVGAATKASGLGYSELEMQRMGRWGLNSAYKNYIRINLTKSCAL